jgi:hypothetical protein
MPTWRQDVANLEQPIMAVDLAQSLDNAGASSLLHSRSQKTEESGVQSFSEWATGGKTNRAAGCATKGAPRGGVLDRQPRTL